MAGCESYKNNSWHATRLFSILYIQHIVPSTLEKPYTKLHYYNYIKFVLQVVFSLFSSNSKANQLIAWRHSINRNSTCETETVFKKIRGRLHLFHLIDQSVVSTDTVIYFNML